VNNLTSWTYDGIDQVLTEIDPLSKTVTYSYDAAGQLTRIVDRKSQRRDFAYDNVGRRTQEYWCPSGSGSASGCGTSMPTRIFTYSYDAANQLTEVNETDSRYTFTYDNGGRMTGMSTLGSNMPQVRLTNTYDARGNRTNVTDNLSSAGSITYTFDAINRITRVALAVGGTADAQVDFGYDATSRLTSMSRQIGTSSFTNRTITTFAYDNADRMTSITHTYAPFFGSPSTLATYTYAYNAASELTAETHKDGTLTYSYDNTSQLTGVDGSGGTCGASGCDESFGYDVNGNRTMSGYSTGTGNRLTSDGTHNYTYDDNGNMLTKTRISDSQKHEFSWDYRNRLTQVLLKNSGGTVLQQSDFTYDALDRRIIKSFDDDGPGPHSATVTKTIYDGPGFVANSYADFNGSNTLTMRYLYGPAVDMILARRSSGGTVAWHLADHLGTVRDLADTSGVILSHISYSGYGKVTSESNAMNGDRFKFASREFDTENNQYYNRARVYDPAAGRFVSEDPIRFRAADGNLFRYVGNGVTGRTDPSGLDWLDRYSDWFRNLGVPANDVTVYLGDVIHSGLNALGVSDQTLANTSGSTLAIGTGIVVAGVVVGAYFGAPAIASGFTYGCQYFASTASAYAAPAAVRTGLVAAAAALYPKLAVRSSEWHHFWPVRFGPPPLPIQNLVPMLVKIPAAYHRQIHLMIDRMLPKAGPGQLPPTYRADQVWNVLQQVYGAFPLQGFPTIGYGSTVPVP
jgi:RHS repeat-associated protein